MRRAQHNVARARLGGMRSAQVLVPVALLLALASTVVACSGEAPVPEPYRAKVEGARASLELNWDGLPRPVFAFAGIRCRVDGGLLVVFHERGGRHSGASAVAMQGPRAADDAWAWAGGYGIRDVSADPEVRFFFSESPEAPCPPAPR